MLCGARGPWGAAGWGGVGAGGICASALAGWVRGVRGWRWSGGDVPQAPSSAPGHLEGLLQAPEDIRVVLGCGEPARVDSLEMERIGEHGVRCVLQHPSPGRLQSTALRCFPYGRRTRPSRVVSTRADFCSSHSHRGPLAGHCPWVWAWAWAWVRVVESWRLAAAVGLGESL